MLSRKADSKGGLAYALSLLGQVAFEQGDVVAASDHFAECLRLNQEVGHRQSVSRSFFFLASAMAWQGDYVQAHALYKEGLTIAITLEHRGLIASCLEGLAIVATAQGQHAWAARLWGAAQTVHEPRFQVNSYQPCQPPVGKATPLPLIPVRHILTGTLF